MTRDEPAGHAAAGTLTPAEGTEYCRRVVAEVERVVVGKRSAVEMVLLGILAGGHVLIEDLPGLGKTLLARTFAQVLGLRFTRLQFTPDMLPADVTGAAAYDPRATELTFRPGPVFTNLLLADEINRTPPKTQAALLEAMAEGQVSVDGVTRPLEQPFVVLATDNPIEYEGTYPLPEAQLDRFLLRISLGYLDADDELAMVAARLSRGAAPPQVDRLCDASGVLALRACLEDVHVEADVLRYAVDLVAATRTHAKVAVGASPRGTLAIIQLARGHAILHDRDYVTPGDVKAIAAPALAHRLSLHPEMWVRRIGPDDIIAEILDRVPAPRVAAPSPAGTGG